MNTEIPFIVVSADRAVYGEELNAQRRDTFEHQLRQRELDFKPVLGSYKGEQEHSYIVLTPNAAAEDTVLRLARRYGQESVLFVDANRYASLATLYPDVGGPDIAHLKGIGFWRAASYEEAAAVDAWTKDGDAYYVTRALP